MTKRSLRNDTGSAFVELALVLPLLFMLLVGSVELGRMAYAAIEVSNAARAAVAYGSQNPITSIDFPTMKAAASQDASDLTAMGATLETTPSDTCVCQNGSSTPTVDCHTLAQTCCPPNETCAASIYTGTGVVYVKAVTTATVPTMFHYPGLPSSFTLQGFAQMRVVQE